LSRHKILIVAAVAALAGPGAIGQSDSLGPIRFLEGKWEGKATGEPGKGVSTREYRFDLNGRFLSARNKSVYDPKSSEAKPEVHEDFGMYSYDRALKKVVLRQFHGEGFVNEYTLDSISADGKSLEFTTVRIENIAPGWRAKEAYRIVSADEFAETFSLVLTCINKSNLLLAPWGGRQPWSIQRELPFRYRPRQRRRSHREAGARS
jgi:hypothetical protein